MHTLGTMHSLSGLFRRNARHESSHMKTARIAVGELSVKAPTGITGFDEITRGGMPRGRTTLLVGGPGSGKTIFALQFLMHGAKNCKEPDPA